jgi:hypothetical protein
MESKNKKPLHPSAAGQRQQLAKDKLLGEILNLANQADRRTAGKERDQLVRRIQDLTVEYQAEG